MSPAQQLLKRSNVHVEWFTLLEIALQQVDEQYLNTLLSDDRWLPGNNNLFAAFRRDRKNCRYILFGESPYPRAESANGIAFYDAAVTDIWSATGLSKPVNRATSLRNIMKTALLAQGLIKPETGEKIPQSLIAAVDKSSLIQTIQQFFSALQIKGFLMFNATPVLHPDNPPNREAKYWTGFLNQLLIEIAAYKNTLPTLVLWGKIAHAIEAMPGAAPFPKIRCEHPYNLSFINNPQMQQLFARLQLLNRDQ